MLIYKWLIIPIALVTLVSGEAQAYDFHLLMERCSTTAGYLVLSEQSLKTVPGTPTLTSCSRAGKKLLCEIRFQDGSEGPKPIEYTIQFDSPPKLIFGDDAAGDWIMVDTTQHAAVMITRIVDDKFAAAKVCQGGFATQHELESRDR